MDMYTHTHTHTEQHLLHHRRVEEGGRERALPRAAEEEGLRGAHFTCLPSTYDKSTNIDAGSGSRCS